MTYSPSATAAAEALGKHEHAWRARLADVGRRPDPGPGHRPDDLARAEERRQAAAAVREAAQAAHRERGAQDRADRQASYDRLVQYRQQIDIALGQATFDLGQATSRYDLAAALEAAGKLADLQRVEDALKRHEAKLRIDNLGRSGPVIGLGRL